MYTLVAGALFVMLIGMAWYLWPSRLNPLLLLLISWAPGVVFTTVPVEFITAHYEVLNHGVGAYSYGVLALSLLCFAAGVLMTREVLHWRRWDQILAVRSAMQESCDSRLWQLFIIGLTVFVYAFSRSGLTDQLNLDPEEVLQSRLALHLGPLSYSVIFLDVTSVVFFAKFMESRRGLYLMPTVVTLLCYAATLQKSRMMFIALSALFVLLLYPAQARSLLFGTFWRRALSILTVLGVLALLFVMNAIRGIGLFRYTDLESPLVEQIFIYSGGTAILNLAGALEGYIQVDPPTMGLILGRPILWHFIDRDLLNPTKYFEGINASSFLIYPWADFRELGTLIVTFFVACIITFLIYKALQKTIIGLMLGAVGFISVAYSINTDVIFDPTTPIILVISLFAHWYCGFPRKPMTYTISSDDFNCYRRPN